MKLRLVFVTLIFLFLCFGNAWAVELVELEKGVCFHNADYYRGSEPIFSAIDSSEQVPSFEFIKNIAKNALIGKMFTSYLQINKTVSSDPISPFKAGTYTKCSLGCIKHITYFGQEYHNICVNKICKEGQLNEPFFCDSGKGNDIYYLHQLFWCDDVPRVAMYCGSGAKCTQTDDGLKCRTYNSTSSTSNGTTYAVEAPRYPSGSFMVVAYQNGRKIASKPLSNLSAGAYVARNGPVYASRATSYAKSTGLTSTVAGILKSNTTVANTGNSRPSFTVNTRYNSSASKYKSTRNLGTYSYYYPSATSTASMSSTTPTRETQHQVTAQATTTDQKPALQPQAPEQPQQQAVTTEAIRVQAAPAMLQAVQAATIITEQGTLLLVRRKPIQDTTLEQLKGKGFPFSSFFFLFLSVI